MTMKLRWTLLIAVALMAVVTMSAAPAPQAIIDPAFPHVALNQSRMAPQVTPHASGCTICTQTCEDPDTHELYPCHCTDYQECGGGTEESGCFPAYSCNGTYCSPDWWYLGCKFVFYPGSGSCATCNW